MSTLPLHRFCPTPPPVAALADEFRPLCYETLIGAASWHRLPPAVRSRFEAHEAHWAGEMTLHASACGRWVARLCKLVGSPLPPASDAAVPAAVDVEADRATGGSRWVRRYRFPHRTVEIRSVKSIDARGHMVERLAMGLRMELDVHADDGALHFVATGYHLEIPLGATLSRWTRERSLRLRFPSWWLPGYTHVVHRDLGDGSFRFTMTIRHVWLGELFHHDGVFRSTAGRT
jgi:hypothetical protein